MSNSWSQLPSAPRRGSSKTYSLSQEHSAVISNALTQAKTQLALTMGDQMAAGLMHAVREGFNFETIDEGFAFKSTPYTILAMSHKGQTAGNSAWANLEPHPALRNIAFNFFVFFAQAQLVPSNELLMPSISNWDRLQDGKVISVTRCHFTPNGRPLGVCRKEDWSAAPATASSTASINAWAMAAAPAANSVAKF